ncbi:ICP0-binding domain of ubiquitin-specific protease 7-domain-containing protein [Fennellomyces sp. T-0311]|nr:ICP0-binding domain of ubiquitin-specific protease 7-domain-containing protein [Fennellomyces sp. T-0311]
MLNRSTKDSEELPEYGETTVTPTQEPGPPRALSIVHDWFEISNGLFPSIEEPVIQTQCHHWVINDWEALPVRATSHTFTVQKHQWKLVMYAKGNAAAQQNHFSLYLSWEGDPVDPNAHICVMFAFVLSNRQYPSSYTTRCGHHRFDPMGSIQVWGYNSMASIESLRQSDQSTGRSALLQNGQIRVSVIIRVVQDVTGYLWDTDYNSRKSVGYVPIRNERLKQYDQGLVGAFLQVLFCTNLFRRKIFQIQTNNASHSPVAIQMLFYKLQYSLDSVDSQLLGDIFHAARDVIDVRDAIYSHLTQNSAIKKIYDEVFRVRFGVDEIALPLYYTAHEYYGLEQALEAFGKEIDILPPVLHIDLERWYDHRKQDSNKNEKNLKRFTYPEEINMGILSSISMGKGKTRSKSIPSQKVEYVLHSVIMRNSSTKKYHVYIRPYSGEAKWLRFEVHRVIPANVDQVLQTKNFGYSTERAQMLSYVQKSKLHEVLIDVSFHDIPRHIGKFWLLFYIFMYQLNRCVAQWGYQEMRGSVVPSMDRINLIIVTDDTFRDSKVLDPFDINSRCVTKVVRNMYSTTVNDIYAFISEHFSVPKETFRLWTIIQRVNKTLRVDAALDTSDIQSNFRTVLDKYHVKRLDGDNYLFYLEYHSGKNLNENDILIFIRYFDAEVQNVRGISHLVIDKHKKIGSITDTVNAMVGNPSDTALEFYDVVHETLIEKCDSSKSFQECGIKSGDVICAQRAATGKEKFTLFQRTMDLYDHYVLAGLVKRSTFNFQRTTSRGKDIMPE